MCLEANCKNGISFYELHRCLCGTQKTAWSMLQLRLATYTKASGQASDMQDSKRPLCKLSWSGQRLVNIPAWP
jgi:hypothetical protein